MDSAVSFSKRLRIIVTNHEGPVLQAHITVYGVLESPAIVYYQFTDVFGQVVLNTLTGLFLQKLHELLR